MTLSMSSIHHSGQLENIVDTYTDFCAAGYIPSCANLGFANFRRPTFGFNDCDISTRMWDYGLGLGHGEKIRDQTGQVSRICRETPE